MSFGPYSTNPRERRAYVHAKLTKARVSGETADFEAAQAAVDAIGASRKARVSNFGACLINIAMQDPSTRIIVERGTQMIDPVAALENGPVIPGEGNSVSVAHIREFEGSGFRGGSAYIASQFAVPHEFSARPTLSQLFISEHVTHPVPDINDYPIPTRGEEVDVPAVRLITDEVRVHMAALVEQASLAVFTF